MNGNNTILICTCEKCGRKAIYELSDTEQKTYNEYQIKGHSMGKLKDLFPDMPLWIAASAIDNAPDKKTICPDCI